MLSDLKNSGSVDSTPSPAHSSGRPLGGSEDEDHSLILASHNLALSDAATSLALSNPANQGTNPSDGNLPIIKTAGYAIETISSSFGGGISLSSMHLIPANSASTLPHTHAEDGDTRNEKAQARPISQDRSGNPIIASQETHSLRPLQTSTPTIAAQGDSGPEHVQIAPDAIEATTSAEIGEISIGVPDGLTSSGEAGTRTGTTSDRTSLLSSSRQSDSATSISGRGQHSTSSTESSTQSIGNESDSTSTPTGNDLEGGPAIGNVNTSPPSSMSQDSGLSGIRDLLRQTWALLLVLILNHIGVFGSGL